MKSLTILVAHRVPSLHYAEAVLPRGFQRIGVDTTVITSDLVAPSARAFLGKKRFHGPDEEELRVIRLGSVGIGNLALPNPFHLKNLLKEIAADALLCIAPTKGLPFYPFTWEGAPLFTQIGEHMPLKGLRKALKKWAYNRIINRSKLVFTSKIESEEFLAGLLGRTVKLHKVFLPFDEKIFYWDQEERDRTRKEMGLSGPVIISASMIAPHKKYEALVEAVSRLNASLLLVGLLETSSYARKLAAFAREKLGQRFIPMPFLPQEKLRPLFNAADVGVWTWTSVAIKQALGTGLPVVMWKPRHLIEENVQGYYFQEATPEHLTNALSKALNRSWDRNHLHLIGQSKYSSKAVAQGMLKLMREALR